MSWSFLLVFAQKRDSPISQFDDHDAVICCWLIPLTKGIFSRADLTGFIEPQVMKLHERSRFERGKIRTQLGMPFVELNVRRFHVDSVFSETGQGLVGFLLAPAIGEAVHHFSKCSGIEMFLTIL